jgi:hypothetical protein
MAGFLADVPRAADVLVNVVRDWPGYRSWVLSRTPHAGTPTEPCVGYLRKHSAHAENFARAAHTPEADPFAQPGVYTWDKKTEQWVKAS